MGNSTSTRCLTIILVCIAIGTTYAVEFIATCLCPNFANCPAISLGALLPISTAHPPISVATDLTCRSDNVLHLQHMRWDRHTHAAVNSYIRHRRHTNRLHPISVGAGLGNIIEKLQR